MPRIRAHAGTINASEDDISSLVRLVRVLAFRAHSGSSLRQSVCPTMPDNQEAIRFYKKLGLVDEAIFLERHIKAS